MNKTELVQSVLEKVALPKKQVSEIIEATFQTITDALAEGDSVALVGFGTFTVKARAARKGVNPKTGETIQIKATNAPGFKAGKLLKDACNLEAEVVN
ncbi:MAG: HU family DNA-binding protein [Gammaproteobacteria bacterium]